MESTGAQVGTAPPQVADYADEPAFPGFGAAADGDPLVHQRGLRDLPPFPDPAEPEAVGDPHLVQVYLVEFGFPVIWRSGRTVTPGAVISQRK